MARPRKEQELDIARRAVEETIRLLAVRGDFDVPLSEVAQAVGCTAPALYSHFRNKNALLRAARDEGFRRLYKEKLAGPAPVLFRSRAHVRRPFVRRPLVISSRGLNVSGAGCRSR